MAGEENRLFPPEYEEAAEAKTAILHVIGRALEQLGYECSRLTYYRLPTYS